jgi:hypothetical protein
MKKIRVIKRAWIVVYLVLIPLVLIVGDGKSFSMLASIAGILICSISLKYVLLNHLYFDEKNLYFYQAVISLRKSEINLSKAFSFRKDNEWFICIPDDSSSALLRFRVRSIPKELKIRELSFGK